MRHYMPPPDCPAFRCKEYVMPGSRPAKTGGVGLRPAPLHGEPVPHRDERSPHLPNAIRCVAVRTNSRSPESAGVA